MLTLSVLTSGIPKLSTATKGVSTLICQEAVFSAVLFTGSTLVKDKTSRGGKNFMVHTKRMVE